jgi:nitrogen fixation protein
MARKSTSTKSESKSAEMKRTTYPFAVNVTADKDGVETLIYTGDQRSYGEGPIVALKNGLKKELENNRGAVIDKSSLTAFGGEIALKNGGKLYASVIFSDAQCPACGAPRDQQHDWCPACSGNVEIDLAAQVADLADEF